jgi:hypothetical protein
MMPDPRTPSPAPDTLSVDGAETPSELPRCLAVRSRAEQLHIVALWQVLGQYAPRVVHTRVITKRKMAVEELSVTVVGIPDGALADMVSRLSTLPWVLDAWFHTPTDSHAGYAQRRFCATRNPQGLQHHRV